MTTNEVTRIYDTLLSIPGMNEPVKLDLKISRKQVLLLTQVIERGLNGKDNEATGWWPAAPEEDVSELSAIMAQCLQKAGLTELNTKLRVLFDE